ncbi:MAG: tRNA (adenosine(37)-N6)-threonylcarbamoyltransferase complex dimerization subunit type 1 TsaB, partial [Rickettsiales bacterium]|nr:tRNA (adenosine(37)-N6)-threonylcarbamoyltransferase complex dimerization subunit type 1 TsaB [Rickettsiales bacterium]
MKILAFDTSNGTLSIAILEDQRILQLVNIQENGKQAEMLVALLERVLRNNKIWYSDLDLIATTKGPGSFTGVRIGLSCARALKLATNLPLVLVDSLNAIAYKHRDHNGQILAAIDAKMDEFFVAEFFSENKKLRRLTESRLITKDEFIKISQQHNFICGNTTS